MPGPFASPRSRVSSPDVLRAGGVGTAMVTPFTPDGELDLDGAAAVVEHLLALGNTSLVVSGTTGEATTTSDEEKDRLLRTVVRAVGGRATVIAGVGTADTAHSVGLARAAERAGADAVLVVTPYYCRPSQAGLVAHFTTVADACGLPVMLYDIPGRSGTTIAVETLARVAEHPRIRAVKDATGDVARAARVMAATGLAYWSGTDELNLPLLTTGAVGVISVVGHVTAASYVRILESVRRGDLRSAQETDRALIPVVRALMNPGPGAVTAKAALQVLGVLTGRTVRLPYLPATDDEVAHIAAALAGAGLESLRSTR